VIIPDVGGGFGQKIHWSQVRRPGFAAGDENGRPVKWIEDRTEHMMAGGHALPQEFEAEAAVKNDGTVLGLKFKEYDDVGGSISTLTIHFTNKLNNLSNTYKTPAIYMEGNAVVTNKCPVIPNRGIGKPACVSSGAHDGPGRSGIELSPIGARKNLINREMPTAPSAATCTIAANPGLLKTLLEKIEYDKLREEQRRPAKGRAHGYRHRHQRRARRAQRGRATWRSFLK
jgi:carbon-monoxide dehydrogenase large subunit